MEKIIFHIDVNSAFLSWTAAYRVNVLGEQIDLRQIPSAICGNTETRHGIILAKSGPAKKFGIRTGEPLFQARQKCPQLVIAPPDYGLYVEASHKFVAVLRQMAPVVEQYSIDEAWADLSGTEKLYGPPVLAAEKIKERIKQELGFTVNIGVSSNKLLAKMAGDFEKPDKVHTLFPWEIETKLWPLPVRDLFMVGPASEKKLHGIGITTIGQLAQADLSRIKARLHKHGELIWNFANGYCEDQVTDEIVLNKGYGNSLTTAQDVTDTETAHKIILSLCETIGMRMRKDRQCGSCIAVSLRTADFEQLSRQSGLNQPTDATIELYRAACHVFGHLWDGRTPLRQLGVSVTKVGQNVGRQAALFGEDSYDKLAKSDNAVDRIRERFGENAIMRACFLQADVAPLAGGLAKERRTGVTKPLPEDPE